MVPDREVEANVNGRRSFIKLLAAAPLLATIGSRGLASTGDCRGRKVVFR